MVSLVKSKSTKASNKQSTSWSRSYKLLIIVVSLILLIFLYDLSPLGGNIRFYSKWLECGQRPVATAGSGFLNAGAPHYYSPQIVSLMRGSPEYFCTPLEAEKAGYSANPDRYEFPHLKLNQ